MTVKKGVQGSFETFERLLFDSRRYLPTSDMPPAILLKLRDVDERHSSLDSR